LLDECLAAVGRSFPVTVVDNSSTSEVRTVTERHGAHYLDPGSNLGFAAGVNVGLAHRTDAAGDVLLLNPDAVIDGDGVIGLHRMLHSRPDRAAVAPAQVDPVDGTRARVDWPFPTPWGAWMEAAGAGRFRRGDEFMIGSVLLLRGEAVAEVGGFDERFFLYAEETDWQRRARDLGWGVALCPQITAVHVGAGTGGDATVREAHFHASQERYVRKYFGPGGWQAYRAGVMVGSALRAVVLPGARGRAAADRFHRYRKGPCRIEARL
jgi:GT2 family glycosyltransferase